MTTVNVLPRNQSLAGLVRAAGAHMKWKPNTAAMLGGGRVLTTQELRVDFGSGDTPATSLEPCDGSTGWCWEVSLYLPYSRDPILRRYVLVPDSATPIAFDDLVDVIPSTLQPSDAAAPAWDAAAGRMVQQFEDALNADGSSLRLAAESAAEAAVENEVTSRDLVQRSDPGIPSVDETDRFRVLNALFQVAFELDPEGVTRAYDLFSHRRRLGGATELPGQYPGRWTIKDADGKVAFSIREDGTTFIGDPVFGTDPGTSSGGVERVILAVQAGQSNGEGRGRPWGPRLDRPHRRLHMWDWASSTITPATVPLSSQQQRVGLSPLTMIGREFVAATDESTAVVLLNVAAGGSGLVATPTQGSWKVDYAGPNPRLYEIAKARISSTLAAIAQRWPGAAVEPWLYWHQGEADTSTSEAAYAAALDEVVAGLRTHLSDTTVPFTAGGIVPEYGPAAGVRRALFGVQSRLQYAAYTDGIPNGGGSSNVTDTVHYHREGVERLGRNMHRASLRAATATTTQVPHKPLDVTATFRGGVLSVRWSEPCTRYTGFVVEYSIDDGPWVAATRDVPTECAQTVTGLTGTTARVRISAQNGSLTTEPTIPVTAI